METSNIDGRIFVGIGKMLFDTPAEDWNIPNLHFTVCKCNETTYEAVNLEFGLVAIGSSGQDAAQGLAALTSEYVVSVTKDGNGYKELREIARNSFMSEFWCIYRGIEFDLAETSDDLSHYFDKRINKAIQDSFNDKLKEAIRHGAGNAADEILSMLAVRPPIVEYREVASAA